MKKLLLLLSLFSVIVFTSCDDPELEKTVIDAANMNVNVSLSCVDVETYSSYSYHTIYCSGSIEGISGHVKLYIDGPGLYSSSGGHSLTLAGGKTTFAFTKRTSSLYNDDYLNKRATYDIYIKDNKGKEIFRSSVVIIH